jgi:hypothetical protein
VVEEDGVGLVWGVRAKTNSNGPPTGKQPTNLAPNMLNVHSHSPTYLHTTLGDTD